MSAIEERLSRLPVPVPRRRSRGFTLAELMGVVVVVGILAVIAAAVYRRFISSSRMAEATHMLEGIRTAQEAHKAETGSYLNISPGLRPPNMYPAQTPGQFKTAWGAKCTWCTTDWANLNVVSDAPVMFGYATQAASPPSTPTSLGVSITLNGQAMDLSALGVGTPWFVATASGDTNGNGVFCNLATTSAAGDIFFENEGE
jgi:prepilin-type N-terminal cleavage/methylation domain-containing protein